MSVNIEMSPTRDTRSSSVVSDESSRSISPIHSPKPFGGAMVVLDRGKEILEKKPRQLDPQSIKNTTMYTRNSPTAIKVNCLFTALILAGSVLFVAGAFTGGFPLILAGAGLSFAATLGASVSGTLTGSIYLPGWNIRDNKFEPIPLIESVYPMKEVDDELVPQCDERQLASTTLFDSEIIGDTAGGDWEKYLIGNTLYTA